jgi:hypothetical protein
MAFHRRFRAPLAARKRPPPFLRQSKQKAAATKDWETIGNTAFDFAQSFP